MENFKKIAKKFGYILLPDTNDILQHIVDILDSTILTLCIDLTKLCNKKVISTKEIFNAIQLYLQKYPEYINYTECKEYCQNILDIYHQSDDKYIPREKKISLCIPVIEYEKYLKNTDYFISKDSPVLFACFIQYIIERLFIDIYTKTQKKRITFEHICLAVKQNPYLCKSTKSFWLCLEKPLLVCSAFNKLIKNKLGDVKLAKDASLLIQKYIENDIIELLNKSSKISELHNKIITTNKEINLCLLINDNI